MDAVNFLQVRHCAHNPKEWGRRSTGEAHTGREEGGMRKLKDERVTKGRKQEEMRRGTSPALKHP